MAPLQMIFPKPAARPVDEPFGLRSGATPWREPGVFGGPSYVKTSKKATRSPPCPDTPPLNIAA
eukprot:9096313-Alexandrium_andersonii.AAC.1